MNFIYENNQEGMCLQSVLNLLDNKEEDGGYICVPGFHNHFDAYFDAQKLKL